MPILATFRQQPDETLDYDFDHNEFLPTGDVISAASVVVVPTMPTPPTTAISADGRTVKVWVYAGGTDKTTYKLTLLATSLAGRIKESDFKVKIQED